MLADDSSQLTLDYTASGAAPAEVRQPAADRRTVRQSVSEFLLPDRPGLQQALLMPMLSHLSRNHSDRWLTCIGLMHASKRECQDYGLNWQRLLQVLPDDRHAVLDLAERVLAAGRSHTVVSWVPRALSEADYLRLEQAASGGNCQAIIVRSL